ncbi:MAG: tetratricopeptide repeat protein [Alphaproteobacteria bacterium]
MRLRFILAAAIIAGLTVHAAPGFSAEDNFLDERAGGSKRPTPPASGNSGTGMGDEFNTFNADDSESFVEKNPDKPPPVEEYNNIRQGVLIPVVDPMETATDGADAESAIREGKGKLNYETLMKYYQQKKYDLIAKSMKMLADGGHVGAQEIMGIMYRQGQGVPKDPAKALTYLTKAADAARPLAQHHVGVMYFLGEGVPSDPIIALMWLHLAIVYYAEGNEKVRAEADRDNVYGRLTRREKDRALMMAKEWLIKRGEAHLLDLQGF